MSHSILQPLSTATGAVELKPRMSAWGKFLGTTAFALFWNGILSVFVYQVIQMWLRGGSEGMKWFMTLFLTPFLAIGLGALGAIGYFGLALFNPRVHLKISQASVALGDSFVVEWTVEGRLDRLRALSLSLEGREEATYQRGTTSHTDKSTFVSLQIAKATQHGDMRCGRSTVQVPADSMFSLDARHNKIIWLLQLKGEIPNWPDVNEEFPLRVLPLHPPSAPV